MSVEQNAKTVTMAQVINKTPHPLHFRNSAEEEPYLTIKPDQNPARVQVETRQTGEAIKTGFSPYRQEYLEEGVRINWAYTIPVTNNTYGDVENLPEKKEGVIFIVSLMVCNAAPRRDDLYIVNEAVRNSHGQIIGAKSVAQNPNFSEE